MTDKKYTLKDLEDAEASAREGDSDRHSNPGRTRRFYRQAAERISLIRQNLIEQGELPDPQKSPVVVERNRIQNELDRKYPNAKSKLIVEYEGAPYQRRYYKLRYGFRAIPIVGAPMNVCCSRYN